MADAGPSLADEIANQQAIKQTAQILRDGCDEGANPGCTATHQTTMDDADTNISDLQGMQADIASEDGSDVDPS